MTQPLSITFRDKLVQVIKEIGPFPGVSTGEVVARDRPSDWKDFAYRGISVIIDGETEAPGTVNKDDHGYRYLVVLSAGTSKGSAGGTTDWVHETRATIRDRFNNKRISEIPQCMICSAAPGETMSRRPWEDAKAVSVLVITCWAREIRP